MVKVPLMLMVPPPVKVRLALVLNPAFTVSTTPVVTETVPQAMKVAGVMVVFDE